MDQLRSLFSADQIQRKSIVRYLAISVVRHLAISTARTYEILLWKGNVQKVPGILSCMQDYIT